jgi:hypothetical protein
MFVIHDPAVVEELIESADELFEAYDGRGRPVEACGEPGSVRLLLSSMQSQEEAVRARVTRYYRVFATRAGKPPDEKDLEAFIQAVADDEIEE